MFIEIIWIVLYTLNFFATVIVSMIIYKYLNSKALGQQTLLDLLLSDLMIVVPTCTFVFSTGIVLDFLSHHNNKAILL